MTISDSYPHVDNSRRSMLEQQDNYKELITEIYESDPLLYADKPRNDAGIVEQELEEYYEMIGHCLIIGDSDVLYKYGIHPLYVDRDLLSASDQLESYVQSFEYTFELEDTPEGVKFYLAMLIREFKEINGESVHTLLFNIV